MLAASDPVKTVVSLDSVALERINERNADRLVRLENNDELGDSAGFNDYVTIKNSGYGKDQ